MLYGHPMLRSQTLSELLCPRSVITLTPLIVIARAPGSERGTQREAGRNWGMGRGRNTHRHTHTHTHTHRERERERERERDGGKLESVSCCCTSLSFPGDCDTVISCTGNAVKESGVVDAVFQMGR